MIEIKAKKIIAECDLLRHLKLLRKVIRCGDVIARHGVIQQRPQRAGAKRSEFAESVERLACFCALFRIAGVDLEGREIELVEIVPWLFLNRGSELLLLLGEISFRAGQPTRDNVKSGPVAIAGGDLTQRFSREIELPKAQRC